jgi:hypothetical protein
LTGEPSKFRKTVWWSRIGAVRSAIEPASSTGAVIRRIPFSGKEFPPYAEEVAEHQPCRVALSLRQHRSPTFTGVVSSSHGMYLRSMNPAGPNTIGRVRD